MQGFRFKTENSPTYCIMADTLYFACHIFVQEMKTLGLKGTIHTLGYGHKQHSDTFINAEYYVPSSKSACKPELNHS